jgi:hypothetical protein
VDVSTGMIAAGRLQALIESRASGTSMVDMRLKMYRIIEAMHSTVPEELWPEILRKIDGPVAADSPADEFEGCDQAEDGNDPVESAQAAGTRQCPRGGQGGVAITDKVHESTHRPMRVFVPPTQTDENDSF